MRRLVAALAVLVFALSAPAGEYNKKLSVGDAAPDFKDLAGVDGQKHSLADFKDRDVVVVVFTCNHCPVAVAYQERLVDFTKKYAAAPNSKVGVVAVSVSTMDEDQLPQMKERAKEAGFNFPYLHDPSQNVGRAYGASVTPQFFVLNKERKVVYMGAMDDSLEPKDIKARYLDPAVDAVLQGKAPATAETRPVGCGISYGRK